MKSFMGGVSEVALVILLILAGAYFLSLGGYSSGCGEIEQPYSGRVIVESDCE